VKSKAKWFVTDFKELIDALWDSSWKLYIFLNGEAELSKPVLSEIKIVTVGMYIILI
jgi:hypothetical protein